MNKSLVYTVTQVNGTPSQSLLRCDSPEDMVLSGGCRVSPFQIGAVRSFGPVDVDDTTVASGWYCNCGGDSCAVWTTVVCLDL